MRFFDIKHKKNWNTLCEAFYECRRRCSPENMKLHKLTNDLKEDMMGLTETSVKS